MIEKLNCCDGNICKSKASVINARELFRGYKLDVFVKENEISDYIGQKRSNAESLKKYFGFRGVRFWPLERLADKKRLFESKSFFKDVFVDRQNLTVSILCDE